MRDFTPINGTGASVILVENTGGGTRIGEVFSLEIGSVDSGVIYSGAWESVV